MKTGKFDRATFPTPGFQKGIARPNGTATVLSTIALFLARTLLTLVSVAGVLGIVGAAFALTFSAASHTTTSTEDARQQISRQSMSLVVQVHEDSTTTTAEAIADAINASGFGPAVVGTNGIARWAHTRSFNSAPEVADALIHIREKFACARAVDAAGDLHTMGAIVCSLGRPVTSVGAGATPLSSLERLQLIRTYMEAFHKKQSANSPCEPEFNWDSQTYWDERNERLTVFGPLTTICCLPLYDNVDWDEFIASRGHWQS